MTATCCTGGCRTAGIHPGIARAPGFEPTLHRDDIGWLLRCRDDGRIAPLDAGRWSRLDRADVELLDRVSGPTLDVGCGPGRFCAALLARGVGALGIDVSAEAVRRTRALGGVALQRGVFDPLPATGLWSTVLLADGNIGIGGDVQRLLRRVRTLLAPGGALIVELASPGIDGGSRQVRLETAHGHTGPWFPWAVLPADRVVTVAASHGLRVMDTWETTGRWFARCVTG